MDINQQLSPHFRLKEFLHNGDPEGVTPAILENLKKLAARLEEVRKQLGGKPLKITSGFRSWKHHLEIYKAKGITDLKEIPTNSYHLKGLAADFMVQGMSSENARRILNNTWEGGMEVGTPHVHLDIRGHRERFYP